MDQNNQQRVVFEADQARRNIQSYQSPQQSVSKIVQLVIKLSGGRIRDEKQAQFIILIVIVVIIIISLFLFFHTGYAQQKVTPKMIEIMKRSIPRAFRR